jgi:hypothetical protein
VDEVLNPYAPGAGTQPPELAGRDRERHVFGVLLGRLSAGRSEQNLVLWGLRGVGKTVLLNRFAGDAEDAGWGQGYIELRGRGPLRPVLAQIAAQAAHSLPRRKGIRETSGSSRYEQSARRARLAACCIAVVSAAGLDTARPSWRSRGYRRQTRA